MIFEISQKSMLQRIKMFVESLGLVEWVLLAEVLALGAYAKSVVLRYQTC